MKLFLFLFGTLITIVNSLRGEIISCPAWRLNSLPEVKRFLKEPGHADSYENLSIKWIKGRNPDLYIYSQNETLIEKVDLSPLTTTGLHELMIKKGFTKKIKQF